jgi:hypothetical protein
VEGGRAQAQRVQRGLFVWGAAPGVRKGTPATIDLENNKCEKEKIGKKRENRQERRENYAEKKSTASLVGAG